MDDDSKTQGPPRWVIVLVAATVVIVGVLIVLLLVGQGHGPGMHR